MASFGVIQTALGRLDAMTRAALTPAFSELATKLTLGPTDAGVKSPNFSAYRFDAVTSSLVGGEFIVQHGKGVTPQSVIPILPLDSTGYTCVPLTVTRAADAQRIYLASSSTSATIALMVEF